MPIPPRCLLALKGSHLICWRGPWVSQWVWPLASNEPATVVVLVQLGRGNVAATRGKQMCQTQWLAAAALLADSSTVRAAAALKGRGQLSRSGTLWNLPSVTLSNLFHDVDDLWWSTTDKRLEAASFEQTSALNTEGFKNFVRAELRATTWADVTVRCRRLEHQRQGSGCCPGRETQHFPSHHVEVQKCADPRERLDAMLLCSHRSYDYRIL